ncbi:MAG: 1-phosphofructokinase family hexose kinase [Bacteroidetes bacterium]|nr:1-phosphofructokinase family hexose kinase [Bacteroidota bacterium]
MSSIVTITFNPCIDKYISVTGLISGKKIRCAAAEFWPGGGGINVARAITRLNGDALAIYFAGGYHGGVLNELLKKENVPALPVSIANETRENWMIMDNASGKQYRFIMPGPTISENEFNTFKKNVESIKKEVEFIVISGSAAIGISNNMMMEIGEIAKRKKAKLVVDTSGDALKRALEYGVYMIKPSISELSSLIVAFNLKDGGVAAAASDIVARGYSEVVVVSMGAAGAMLVTKDLVTEINPPPVKVRSTVGAGDSLVAGILYSLVNKKNLTDAVKYGVACGTATTMKSETELFSPDDVDKVYALMREMHVAESSQS